jgi:transketolase
LADPADGAQPVALIVATGSEVALAMQARELLSASGIAVRVVSMPSWALFDAQDRDYRDSVLPPSLAARVSVEAASGFGWERHVGPLGRIIAVPGFGASGPAADLHRHFGFTPDDVAGAVRELVARHTHE